MPAKAISYGRQTIEEDDIRAVVEALSSPMLTQGPRAAEFEEALKAATGARYAVCCTNGTAALHLACMAAGLGKGDGVVTSPVTFLASANCAVYVGARPFFADIDPATLNISPSELERALDSQPGIKAVIPVHFAGRPCEMEEISRIARPRGLTVIEDACHALGAEWRSSDGSLHRVGSCSHSDMTVFSFHPVKSITTGEGGAVTTNDRALYERLKLLRSHGVVRERLPEGLGQWYYEMPEPGFNYRLSDIQCALGVSQIKKLDRFVSRRRELASLYTELLSRHPFIETPGTDVNYRSAWHLYPVSIDFESIGANKAGWFELMRSLGIHLQVHYIPVHLQPYYKKTFGFKAGDFPVSEAFYRKEVSLPIYPLLTDEEASTVVAAAISTLAHASAARGGGPLPNGLERAS